MPDQIISVGSTANVAGKIRYSKENTTRTTYKTFQGDYDEMLALETYYESLGWNTDLEQGEADVWVLTLNVPWDIRANETPPPMDELTIQWELDYVTAQKPILDLDIPLANYISDASAKLITDAIKENKDNILINGLNQARKLNIISQIEYTYSLIAHRHMKRGIKTWPVRVPVLRRSAVTPFASDVVWSHQNVGKIYTTSTLVRVEQVDPSLVLALPDLVYTSKLSSDVYVPKAYGWMKEGPKVSTTSHNRRQISQQWTYGLYPIWIVDGMPL